MKTRTAFLLFVIVGGFSSAVNLVARILINLVTSYEIAIVLAFPIALTTAFLLNRLFVFRPAETAWTGQFLRFLLVNLAALAQVFVISVLFARLIFPALDMRFYPDTVAHALGLISPIFTSYWMHRHFTFSARARAELPLGARP